MNKKRLIVVLQHKEHGYVSGPVALLGHGKSTLSFTYSKDINDAVPFTTCGISNTDLADVLVKNDLSAIVAEVTTTVSLR